MKKHIKNLCIKTDYTISKSMKKINKLGTRCLFVLNSDSEFVGTISDGDIRRSILKGSNLNLGIEKIYNSKPMVLKQNDKNITKKIQNLKNKKYLNLIPILNNKNIVVDYVNLDKTFKIKSKANLTNKFPLVIIAGGFGKRFQPFSNIVPKPLLPINGKSLLEIIINKYEENGGKKIILSLGHKANLIISYLKNIQYLKKLNIIKETKPLGTIGSLSKISKFLTKHKNITVTNCDTIITHEYHKICQFHLNKKNDLTIVVCKKSYKFPYGSCILDENENLKKIHEKPEFKILAHTGFYLLNTSLIKLIKKNTSIDFNEFIELCLDNKFKIGVYPISSEEWLDIGDLSRLNDFNFLNNVKI